MYLLNSNRHWTAGNAKGELNAPTQNSILIHVSKIKHCTKQDYYVFKSGNRLFSSTMLNNQHKYNHDILLTKTFSENAPLLAVI